jgi:energy-coupling factor transporter ATP-binding protein EcfA2
MAKRTKSKELTDPSPSDSALDAQSEVSTAISAIEVDKLFGLYDYRLCVSPSQATDPTKLLVLYGDNGSGKTTLLRLVYHLLSPQDKRGHRSAIAPIPFRRLTVRLGDSVMVEATRPGEALTGPFSMRVTSADGSVTEVSLPVNERGAVTLKETDGEVYRAYMLVLGKLESLGISLYYLPDDRRAQSPLHDAEESAEQTLVTAEGYVIRNRLIHYHAGEPQEPSVLESAIRKAEEWMRFEALRASGIGEADTNKIYAEIVKRISRSRGGRSTASGQIEEIVKSLVDIERRSRAFAAFGLVAGLNVADLGKTLQASRGQKQQIMSEVLRPYVDGLVARLNALQSIQEILQVFLESINAFFINKRLTFDLRRGLFISSAGGDRLTPAMLSSGERQLLLLFCNTITARQQASIFIIDEPEISLNVKWQRRLLASLLKLVRGTQVQFLIATHSIEVLAQYRGSVARLQPTGADDA